MTFSCPQCPRAVIRTAHGLKLHRAQKHDAHLGPAARFWARVEKTDGCWLWTGCTANGYGRVGDTGRAKLAHRMAWELTNGRVPPGLCVCHSCDVPRCVRPDHLFLGAQKANLADMMAKGRGVNWRHAPPRGELQHKAKLTDAAVREIRWLRAQGHIQTAIAREFGMSQAQIGKICSGDSWGHVR